MMSIDHYEKSDTVYELMNENKTNFDTEFTGKRHNISFKEIYKYYESGGFRSIIMTNIFNQLTLVFLISAVWFLFGCVNYHKLYQVEVINSAVKCEKLHPFIIFTIAIMILVFLWDIFVFIVKYGEYKMLNRYYKDILNIDDAKLVQYEWEDIVLKIISHNRKQNLQHSLQEQIPYIYELSNSHSQNVQITENMIMNHIMDNDNIYITLVESGLLDIKLRLNLYFSKLGVLFYTKLYEFNIRHIIHVLNYKNNKYDINSFCDSEMDVKFRVDELIKYFKIYGIINLLVMPFTIVIFLIYNLFKYTEDFKNSPRTFGTRQWTPYSKWKLRNIYELNHKFEKKLVKTSGNLYDLFDTIITSTKTKVAKFIVFIAGSILSVLTVLTIYDDNLLKKEERRTGHTILWYFGLFSIIFSVGNSFIPNRLKIYDLSNIIQNIINNLKFNYKTVELKGFFEYKFIIFLKELIFIFMNPFVLFFILPQRAKEIADLLNMSSDEMLKRKSIHYYDTDLENNTNSHFNSLDNINEQNPKEEKDSINDHFLKGSQGSQDSQGIQGSQGSQGSQNSNNIYNELDNNLYNYINDHNNSVYNMSFMV